MLIRNNTHLRNIKILTIVEFFTVFIFLSEKIYSKLRIKQLYTIVRRIISDISTP